MSDILEFACREDFRRWLEENCLSGRGVWLLLGKPGGPKTVTAAEALEEALCFGWIDGQMQRLDERTYKKYFSMRREKSKWSEKNKALAQRLEEKGLMTEYGREKIEEAKRNGQWYAQKSPAVTEESIVRLAELLEGRPEGLEVVMTGRNPGEALVEKADYVTEMKLIKHPFQHGVPAREGIEY